MAPKVDWTPPKPIDVSSEQALEKFVEANPTNLEALRARAEKLMNERKWKEAKEPLQKLVELYPDQREAEGDYASLARVQRELGEYDAEETTLARLAELVPDATSAFLRLLQIHGERQDWPKVLDYAERYEAVDPLRPEPYRYEAEAHEARGEKPKAIGAYRTLLKLDPPDQAEMHYRLARLLHGAGDAEAERQVLMALEDAPRFRAAHKLLLEIAEKSRTQPANPKP